MEKPIRRASDSLFTVSFEEEINFDMSGDHL